LKDRAEISSGNEGGGQTDISGSDLSRVVRNDCLKELCPIGFDVKHFCFE